MWNCLRDVFTYSQHTWKENQNKAETDSWDKTCMRNVLKLGWRLDKLIKVQRMLVMHWINPADARLLPSHYLFYFILFYFILFYFILFYFILSLFWAAGRTLGEFLLALYISLLSAVKPGPSVLLLSSWSPTWCDLSWWAAEWQNPEWSQ